LKQKINFVLKISANSAVSAVKYLIQIYAGKIINSICGFVSLNRDADRRLEICGDYEERKS
jgi:hypothetical protein